MNPILDKRLLCYLLVLFQFSLFSLHPLSADEDVSFLRESKFEDSLNRPLIVNGERALLGQYLQRLAIDRRISILLDRRIDSAQRIQAVIASNQFDEGIRSLVQQVHADVAIVADTLFVAPKSAAQLLRTRIELNRRELENVPDLTPKRQLELLRRYPVIWDDLESPQEIMLKIAEKYKVKIENLDQIPHDLWRAGTVTFPNFIEASSLILTQFELSFSWETASTIRLIPQPQTASIERAHRPKGTTIEAANLLIKRSFPDLELAWTGAELSFSGTIEQHDAIAVLLGEKRPSRPLVSSPVENSLRLRRFTLTMIRKPFGSLMATLQQQGIEVRYDAEQLTAAGVDLGQLISLELNQATIDQLLEKSCEKVGLTYEIENNVVLLKLAAPKP